VIATLSLSIFSAQLSFHMAGKPQGVTKVGWQLSYSDSRSEQEEIKLFSLTVLSFVPYNIVCVTQFQ